MTASGVLLAGGAEELMNTAVVCVALSQPIVLPMIDMKFYVILKVLYSSRYIQ